MVGDLIDLRIAFAVVTNIRKTICLARIRPEVWRLTHVVMLVTAGRSDALVEHCKWTCGQRLLRVRLEPSPGRGDPCVILPNSVTRSLQLLRIEKKDPELPLLRQAPFCPGTRD
jgi:hypothetical protein